MEQPTLGQTIDLIHHLFDERLDRGNQPYWLHCIRVMLGTARTYPEDIDVLNAALLHDVFEDTSIKNGVVLNNYVLINGFTTVRYSQQTINLIRKLTRDEGVEYSKYIDSLQGDIYALTIKMSDIRDNLSPVRISNIPDSQIKRYAQALNSVNTMRRALEGVGQQ